CRAQSITSVATDARPRFESRCLLALFLSRWTPRWKIWNFNASRQVYDSGQSVATSMRRLRECLRIGPWIADASLIGPFRRNSNPFPLLFAIIRLSGDPGHIPVSASQRPSAAPCPRLRDWAPAVRPWPVRSGGHIREDPASAPAAPRCWGRRRRPPERAVPRAPRYRPYRLP